MHLTCVSCLEVSTVEIFHIRGSLCAKVLFTSFRDRVGNSDNLLIILVVLATGGCSGMSSPSQHSTTSPKHTATCLKQSCVSSFVSMQPHTPPVFVACSMESIQSCKVERQKSAVNVYRNNVRLISRSSPPPVLTFHENWSTGESLGMRLL